MLDISNYFKFNVIFLEYTTNARKMNTKISNIKIFMLYLYTIYLCVKISNNFQPTKQ
jgi:hypothetical protein